MSEGRIAELVKSIPGPKKAAIVMVALGSEASSKILKNLDEHDVERLSTEIARLDNISRRSGKLSLRSSTTWQWPSSLCPRAASITRVKSLRPRSSA